MSPPPWKYAQPMSEGTVDPRSLWNVPQVVPSCLCFIPNDNPCYHLLSNNNWGPAGAYQRLSHQGTTFHRKENLLMIQISKWRPGGVERTWWIPHTYWLGIFILRLSVKKRLKWSPEATEPGCRTKFFPGNGKRSESKGWKATLVSMWRKNHGSWKSFEHQVRTANVYQMIEKPLECARSVVSKEKETAGMLRQEDCAEVGR